MTGSLSTITQMNTNATSFKVLHKVDPVLLLCKASVLSQGCSTEVAAQRFRKQSQSRCNRQNCWWVHEEGATCFKILFRVNTKQLCGPDKECTYSVTSRECVNLDSGHLPLGGHGFFWGGGAPLPEAWGHERSLSCIQMFQGRTATQSVIAPKVG